MTHLSERHFIACPYGLARHFLQAELTSAGGVLEWTLHVAASAPHETAKDVDVTVSPAADPRLDRPWNVAWTPKGDDPYPSFAGTLAFRADERPNVSALDLTGRYEPPMGAVGTAFDLLLGARLATTTAEALLRDLGDRIIVRYTSKRAG